MSKTQNSRRDFIKNTTLTATGLALFAPTFLKAETITPKGFKISLAQWSWHRKIAQGKLTNLDFAAETKGLGIDAIEYVSRFFDGNEKDADYLKELNMRADDNGVTQLLIMVDGEGDLGDASEAKRKETIENHKKWLDAAKTLGCHSIRVNAAGKGTYEEVHDNAIKGLAMLSELAKPMNLNVIVENHGGHSSNGDWLSSVISKVNMDNCGTLPDFGNFCVKYGNGGCDEMYDRYKGVKQLMPFAKAVSAKSHDFDSTGEEINTDYKKMLQIVKKGGYSGYLGIEYEGSAVSEDEGIVLTKQLLEKYI